MSDTIWRPALAPNGPRYRALADEIGAAVARGELGDGARLPPVRELAWSLGVTPGTVARAYQLAESRGLVAGEVGRGTFVRASAVAVSPTSPSIVFAPLASESGAEKVIDMRLNCAPNVGQDADIHAALERLLRRVGPLGLSDYHRYGEDLAERAAGVEWLRSGEVPADPSDVVLCGGAQPAIVAALLATVGGADAVALTETLIHPGLKDCARVLGIRLEPVAQDAEGLNPDALDAACARYRPGAVVLTANHQNPTLTKMSLGRRAAIAEVARRRRLAIIEDDIYGWLDTDRLPSFPSIAPERSWYITSFSKCVAAGLRYGLLLAPPGEGRRAAGVLQSVTQHAPRLVTALTAELITSGDAERIAQGVRAETARRGAALRSGFGDAPGALIVGAATPMAILSLPEPWRASEFAQAAAAEGVLSLSFETFAVGRAPAPHALRLAFGHVRDADEAAHGAAICAQLLRRGPPPADGRA